MSTKLALSKDRKVKSPLLAAVVSINPIVFPYIAGSSKPDIPDG